MNEAGLEYILRDLGLCDLADQHTHNTPHRLFKYLEHWTDWSSEPPFKATTFLNLVPEVDQMITVPHISFWSCCSHHLLPFFGEVSVGYVPIERLIGLSKVAQTVRWIAQKPQVQEHLAHEIADYLENLLHPLGLGVYIKAWHTCQLLSVGPGAPQMVTTVVRGAFKEHRVKMEFLQEVET